MRNLLIAVLLMSVCSAFCATPKKTIFDVAAYGNVSELQRILKTKVNVNAVDRNKKTPLMYAVENNRNPSVAYSLIRAGAKINLRDKYGMTAFIYAAMNDNLGFISALIRAGAKVDDRDKDGMTALMHAASLKLSPDVISALIGLGAKVDDRDVDGWTPLMHAVSANSIIGIVDTLYGSGNKTDDGTKHDTLMNFMDLNTEIVKRLVEAGAKVNDRNKGGMTPLIIAAELNNSPSVVIELIEADANCEAKDNKGKTALDYIKVNKTLKDSEAYRVLKRKLSE